MKAAGKVVEKRGKIALLRNGLADLEQGFELTPGVFERGGKSHFRRRNDGVRHSRQDNTRVGEGSICGNGVSLLVSGLLTTPGVSAAFRFKWCQTQSGFCRAWAKAGDDCGHQQNSTLNAACLKLFQ